MDAPPVLKTAITRSGPRATVVVAGEIDIDTAAQLRHALGAALSESASRVDVDFAGVDFCDCSGLAVLLWAGRQARARGAALRVVNVTSPLVERLFHTTGTAGILLGPPDHGP
ncbi:STAS domain-containing protein [Streptomyces sp. NPDC006551]|uniref:STAS domain-containing protein n=1 Tax=Streptomyces sp. NPDC006551 TaxID=3157178 RepID=UPI0033A1B17C